MKIVFHGATRTVTGSLHEVQVAGKRVLLDCGFYQGKRDEARKLNCCFDFDPKTVDAVFLSHGHTDHCGNLPNLVKQGYRGPIYTTRATAALTALMLVDSAKIQEEDAAYLNQKTLKSWKQKIEPLYTQDDVERTLKLLTPLEYRKPKDLGGFTAELRDAGHVLGSAAISLIDSSDGINGRKPRLVFTGDVGRPHSPVLRDPDPFDAADALITECTYGGKRHPPVSEVPALLARAINETVKRGGWVIMPSFALGRTQSLVQQLHEMHDAKQIPGWLPIYVDSPLANRLTEVFRQFPMLWDDQTKDLFKPFDFPNLTYVGSPDESRKLNDRQGPGIIIASSGMCEGGRILHHLKHHLRYPQNTVILPGFQAENTLGRKIEEGQDHVPILGDMIPLRCRVEKIEGLSAHADGAELVQYVMPLKASQPKVFLVHGEVPSAEAHRAELVKAGFAEGLIPARGDVATV